MPAPPVAATGRYVTLDGMRGLAAIAVALFHFDLKLMPHGYLAVDFFFALSGFVLWKAYHERWRQLGIWRFMLRRILRLYPLFALSILLGTVTAAVRTWHGVPGALEPWQIAVSAPLNGLMLPSPAGQPLYPLNVPAWSMFYEIVVNLILVLVLFRLPRLGLVAAGLILAAALVPVVRTAGSANIGALWGEEGAALLRTGFSFTLGLLLAAVPMPRRTGPLPAVFGCFAATLLILYGAAQLPRVAYDLACIFLAWPLLMVLGARFETPHALAALATMIGEISYALYAIHSPLVRLFRLAGTTLGLPSWQVAPVFVLVTVALAWAATRYFDAWARQRLDRLSAPARDRPASASGA